MRRGWEIICILVAVTTLMGVCTLVSGDQECETCTEKFEVVFENILGVRLFLYHCTNGKWEKSEEPFLSPQKEPKKPEKEGEYQLIVRQGKEGGKEYRYYTLIRFKKVDGALVPHEVYRQKIEKLDWVPAKAPPTCVTKIIRMPWLFFNRILIHRSDERWELIGAWIEPESDKQTSLSDGPSGHFVNWKTGAEAKGPDWCDIETLVLEQVEDSVRLIFLLSEEIPDDARFEVELALDTDSDLTTGGVFYGNIAADYVVWASVEGSLLLETGIDTFTGIGEFPWESVGKPTRVGVEGKVVAIEISSRDIGAPDSFNFAGATIWTSPHGEWIADTIPDEGYESWVWED